MISTVTFAPGDIVKVHQRIQEGDKTRIQIFQGTVLALKGRGINRSFEVQKMVGQVSVERIWPIASPNIEKVEVVGHQKRRVRRAKLNHFRVAKIV